MKRHLIWVTWAISGLLGLLAGCFPATEIEGSLAEDPSTSESLPPKETADAGASEDAGDAPPGPGADVACAPPPVHVPATPAARFAVGTAAYLGGTLPLPVDARDPAAPTIAADLAGVVYYPATEPGADAPASPGRFPVLVILHGNHNVFREANGAGLDCSAGFGPNGPLTLAEVQANFPGATVVPSHLGYAYLGEALAALGHVVVSLDGNDVNCINVQGGFVPERARLVVEHLRLLQQADAGQGPLGARLAGRLDLAHVTLAGHSRGGEAVIVAEPMALAAGVRLDGILSIAPTTFVLGARDAEFRVAALPIETPLFLVLPAADGDVSFNGGMRYYDAATRTASASPGRAWFKAQHFLHGANHNFFNAEWNEPTNSCGIQQPGGDNGAGNGGDRLSPAAQRDYLITATRVFLEAVAGKEEARRALGGQAEIAGLEGLTIQASHADASRMDAFDGVPAADGFRSFGFYPFTGVAASYNQTFFHGNDGYVGTWVGAAAAVSLTLAMPAKLRDAVAFRLAQVDDPLNAGGAEMAVVVALEDAAGRRVTARSDWHGRGTPSWYERPAWLDPSNSCAPTPVEKTVLSSVRIPARCFGGDPAFDPAAVQKLIIEMVNTASGAVALTDFQLTAP